MRNAIPMTMLLILASTGAFTDTASATDWLTLPSTFSHDVTGSRVTQYQQVQAPSTPVVASFRTSGYTNTRSSLNYGSSADNYHRVEKWGEPVRPYGEWRFPFRPYSTPYPNWGAPYAGLNLGLGGAGRGQIHQGNQRYLPPHGASGDPAVDPTTMAPATPVNPDGIFREPRRFNQRPSDPNLFRPYPSGPGTPYPVAPYYDGFQPTYRQ